VVVVVVASGVARAAGAVFAVAAALISSEINSIDARRFKSRFSTLPLYCTVR
jgi:hypothetical protein